MAFIAGNVVTLQVDGQAMTAYTDDSNFDRVRETLETTVFGNTDRTYIAGLRGYSFSLSGPWDAAGDAIWDGADDGATGTFNYSPDGGTTTYSGSALFADYSISSSVDGRVEWSGSVQPTGSVSRA